MACLNASQENCFRNLEGEILGSIVCKSPVHSNRKRAQTIGESFWSPLLSPRTLDCHPIEIEGVTAADEEDTGVTLGNSAIESRRHDAELFAATIFELSRQEVAC